MTSFEDIKKHTNFNCRMDQWQKKGMKNRISEMSDYSFKKVMEFVSKPWSMIFKK